MIVCRISKTIYLICLFYIFKFSWCRHIFLAKFSYWSKFHVNIITGSRAMTIFFIGDGFDICLSFFQYLQYVYNKKLLNVTKCQV